MFKAAKVDAYEKVRAVAPRELADLTVTHPLRALGYHFDVPLLEGDHVTDDAGTGFVHTAPSHGRDDFDVWMAANRTLRERNIDTRIPYTVDADGFLTDDAPGFGPATTSENPGGSTTTRGTRAMPTRRSSRRSSRPAPSSRAGGSSTSIPIPGARRSR